MQTHMLRGPAMLQRGVAAAELVYVAGGHTDAVTDRMRRIKAAVVDLIE